MTDLRVNYSSSKIDLLTIFGFVMIGVLAVVSLVSFFYVGLEMSKLLSIFLIIIGLIIMSSIIQLLIFYHKWSTRKLWGRLNSLKKAVSLYDDKVSKLKVNSDLLAKKFNDENKQYEKEIKVHEKDINRAKKLRDNLQNEKDGLRNDLKNLKREIKTKNKEIKSKSKETVSLRKSNLKLQREIDNKNEEISSLDKDIEKLNQHLQDLTEVKESKIEEKSVKKVSVKKNVEPKESIFKRIKLPKIKLPERKEKQSKNEKEDISLKEISSDELVIYIKSKYAQFPVKNVKERLELERFVARILQERNGHFTVSQVLTLIIGVYQKADPLRIELNSEIKRWIEDDSFVKVASRKDGVTKYKII